MGYFNRGMYFEFLLKKAKLLCNENVEKALKCIDDAIEETYGLAILVYHNISEKKDQYCISPEVFRRQMQYLSENKYNISNYSKLKKREIDYKQQNVIVTFDDARTGLLNDGASVLKDLEIPYTLFIAPSFQKDYAPFNLEDSISGFLTWDNIDYLKSNTKIEIGAHSYSHLDMSKMSQLEIQEEIEKSNEEIKQYLGINCEDFAYPFGRYTKETTIEVAKVYKTVSTIGTGLNFSKISLNCLRRNVVLNMFSDKNFHDLINYENIREKFLTLKNDIINKLK